MLKRTVLYSRPPLDFDKTFIGYTVVVREIAHITI